MAFLTDDDLGLRRRRPAMGAALRASLTERNPAQPASQSCYRYDLPPLDALGEYRTCSDCGGKLIRISERMCWCYESAQHAGAASPSRMQILRARVLLRRALRKRFEPRTEREPKLLASSS